MTQTRRLLDNGNVEITTIKEVPRYSGRIICDSYRCKEFLECEVKENDVLIWTNVRDYSFMKNWDFDTDILTGNLMEDKAILQAKIDEERGQGKYKVYILGAYIHGATSFSISEEGDHRCRWDSSQLGFIAVSTDTNMPWNVSNVNRLATMLTSLYEGYVFEYEIYDEATEDQEIVDSCYFIDGIDDEACGDFCKEALAKYNIDFRKIQPHYE